jgi:hypothetical protein
MSKEIADGCFSNLIVVVVMVVGIWDLMMKLLERI